MKLNPLLLAAFFIVLLVTSCASPGHKRTVFADGFTVITHSPGPFQTRHEGAPNFRKADAIGGRSVSYEKNTIVRKNARRVPCGQQDGFSFAVIILGLPDGQNELTVEIEHPTFLPPQDRIGTFFSRKQKILSKNARALWQATWVFNNPSERVPGKWVYRLKYRDAIIFEDSVEVLLPPA